MTAVQIACLSAQTTPVAPPAFGVARPDRRALDSLGFHGALLRRASGFAAAFCWIEPDLRRQMPKTAMIGPVPGWLATLGLAVQGDQVPLLIEDLRGDPHGRALRQPAPTIAAFAGFPLVAQGGRVVGMVCVTDPTPRALSPEQVVTLQRLADEIAARLGLTSAASAARQAETPATPVPPSDTLEAGDGNTAISGVSDLSPKAVSARLMQWRDTFSTKSTFGQAGKPRAVASLTESKHNLGKIEASRPDGRKTAGTRAPDDKGTTRPEGERAVGSRLSGAILRAFLVMALVVMPSAILPEVTKDAQQMAALVALFAGAMTFVEYNAVYPGLIEFRHAPPFNRTRFALLMATVLLLCLIERGKVAPSALTQFLDTVGTLAGWAMDFPYSPVRLATLMLSDAATAEQVAAVRGSAGIALLVTLVTLVWFVLAMRSGGWPSRRSAFNLWVNLPTFDPTMGADIIRRLDRDARVNVALGFLLPLIIPAVVRIGSSGLEPLALTAPQTLVWTVAIWAFLPASLFMRGIAMARVAQMIREKRQAALDGGEGLVAA